MNEEKYADKPREIAAIDLGSNSFHMVVARVVGQSLQIISRHKQRVRLASGLDDQRNLNNASINRGIECLGMFAERLQGFSEENVRVAATFTLREAKNSHIFLQRAQNVFPYPIEVIPGVEEARLIYLGVSHTQPGEGRKLVIDIGGGSTELVIGKKFTASLTNSKRMGCVSYNERFFKDGQISIKRFASAQIAAELKLESIVRQYQRFGWEEVVGSSGTIKAIREVLVANGHDDGIITRKRLDNLIGTVLTFKSVDTLELPGLSEDRRPVFTAGLAILSGVFQAFNIEKMVYSDGALREGLLYEMEDRFQHSDIRTRTAEGLAERYHIDKQHADNVQQAAEILYLQAEPQLKPKKAELSILLSWAALLHEVGLSISHSGFHKHSAYILQNTNMPGFNQEQQTVLATLTRFHRKTLKLADMPEFTLFKQKHIFPLIRALRLACVLNVQRSGDPVPDVNLTINDDAWSLRFPDGWLQRNRLLAADLEAEKGYWDAVGWTLCIEE
ncbi:exopolyphosphatase [Enterovibrio nigricans]|uniref:Exopolyphosphatase n=1 Tax=Enterovibrio nigricans DSM 22720 TaxID=1121868 RepID=A0A1T4V0J3_9GAMM|nr:exopolyphosphatase [Enterovibrio nigricans]PKF50584.1 exopolyphosphatase [Enterovibrio nigricans]SKA58368.1 exopolyphosphatase / guanosine-5'-triphosphate,3'-diphosphate pyrophosphatase [Enterovibrio nigricans DSM 22720]